MNLSYKQILGGSQNEHYQKDTRPLYKSIVVEVLLSFYHAITNIQSCGLQDSRNLLKLLILDQLH